MAATHTTQNNTTSIITLITGKIQSFNKLLFSPTDAASLGLFRVLFGALMAWEVYRYHQYNRIVYYYIEPKFYFPYELFPFVTPVPGPLMFAVFFIMGVSAIGVALGFFYRLSIISFFLTYTYVFLLDKAQYNNHYYLIILLAFLLICVDAHRWASLDQRFRPDLVAEVVPFWQIFIFRAQLLIVYVYAAIAKLNADWLQGEPMRAWLRARSDYPVVGQLFVTEPGVYFFTYGGLLFDLLVGFMLLWKRTRLLAVFSLLFFHITNKWLFNIGIFPYLMIAATVLFFDTDWPRRVLHSAKIKLPETAGNISPIRQKAVLAFVTIYLTLQILIPLRHWLYPGNVSWTEEGHRFSWHMKLRGKSGSISFTILDPITQRSWPVDMRQDLTDRQISKMAARPDMILQYAHFLKARAQAQGIQYPIIHTESWASLNGRPYVQMIDPTVNLAEAPQQIFAHTPWVVPLPPDVTVGYTSVEQDD